MLAILPTPVTRSGEKEVPLEAPVGWPKVSSLQLCETQSIPWRFHRGKLWRQPGCPLSAGLGGLS